MPPSLADDRGRCLNLGSSYVPQQNDILCGKGTRCYNSPGNERLRFIVKSFAVPYSMSLSKGCKSLLVSKILADVYAVGGVFIKEFEEGWWKMDEGYAREKVGYMLREELPTRYRSASANRESRKNRANASAFAYVVPAVPEAADGRPVPQMLKRSPTIHINVNWATSMATFPQMIDVHPSPIQHHPPVGIPNDTYYDSDIDTIEDESVRDRDGIDLYYDLNELSTIFD